MRTKGLCFRCQTEIILQHKTRLTPLLGIHGQGRDPGLQTQNLIFLGFSFIHNLLAPNHTSTEHNGALFGVLLSYAYDYSKKHCRSVDQRFGMS